MSLRLAVLASLRRLWLCTALLQPLFAHGDWADVAPQELARQSDLIVLGEYLGQEQISPPEMSGALNLGVIRVESVLKGETRALVLLRLPPARPDGLRLSSDLHFTPGQHGLWLLRQQSAGLFFIDRPERFLDMPAARKLIPWLKGH